MDAGSIPVARAHQAHRLLGEMHEIGAGTEAARRHLVERLLVELGATIGGAVNDTAFRRGGRNGCVAATLAGFDDSTLPVYSAHDSSGSDVNPLLCAVMDERAAGCSDAVLTVAHQDLVPKRTWERSEWVNELARPAHVSHFLGSMRFVGPHSGHGFGFMRAAGDRPFETEDRSFLHLVHLGCARLFDDSRPTVRLPPRVSATLDCLLTGAADKEIAERLGLSHHTVHQYVKAIYRAYGVSSRAQLMARRIQAGR